MSSERAGTPTHGRLDREHASMVVYDIVQAVRDHTWSIEHALDALEACVVPDPRITRIEALLEERERRAHNEEGYTLTGGLTGHLRAILRGD